MSWRDRIANTEFTIVTGDGRTYNPLWKPGETSLEFNVAFFDYIALPGTEMVRKEPRGQQYPLVFWFQGDDNIDQALAFKESSKDKRAWQVQHPYYGNILGQPVKIGFNDFDYGITEVVVDFWETLGDTQLTAVTVIPDATQMAYNELTVISPTDYGSKVDLKPADVSTVKNLASKIDAFVGKAVTQINVANDVISDPIYSAFNEYQLLRNAMFNAVDQLMAAPVPGVAAIWNLLAAPARFNLSLQIRLGLFGVIFGSNSSVLAKSSRNNKALYESVCASSLAGMCLAAVNPIAGDYVTRADIATAAETIAAAYRSYLQELDRAYVKISDTNNSFAPSNQTQTKLQQLIIKTIANLNVLAFDAKQERTDILSADSNLILVTHKYMGLDALDANMEALRQLNNIKNKELLLIKKGRKIKYLV